MRLALAPALLALLLLAPTALAQVPPLPGGGAPVYTLTLTPAAGEFTGLASNATASVALTVDLVLGGVVCAQPVVVPVTITATPRSPAAFFAVAPDPAVINMTIGQGPHGVGPTAPGGGSGDSTLTATIGEITTNASIGVDVVATAPAPAGCQGTAPVADATSTPVTIFANMTAPAPPPPPTPEEDTPGPAVVLVAAVVVAVALARRRTR